MLHEALARLLDAQGGVLLLSGEPGLGKTRLLASCGERIERSGTTGGSALWLEGRCVSYGDQLPYFPFQVLIGTGSAHHPMTATPRSASFWSGALRELLPDRHDDLRPLLGSALALAPRPQDAARISGLSPEDLQSAVFDAVLELVRRLARDAPVVLALDDLHWADGTSLALAEELVGLVADSPLLLVLAARPEGMARLAEHALRRQPERTTRLALKALTDESDRALLSALARGADFPAELERRVLERAEGNPLYLEELVRALIDAGALVRSEAAGASTAKCRCRFPRRWRSWCWRESTSSPRSRASCWRPRRCSAAASPSHCWLAWPETPARCVSCWPPSWF